MKTYSLLCVLAAILVTANVSAIELPELLIPVSGQEEQQVRAKQDYFLKKHNYFAKRHRIVRINTDVLLNAPRFRITFFDDASVTVRRERIQYGGPEERSTFIWKGHMENQPIEDFLGEGELTDEDLLGVGELTDDIREDYSLLVGVSIWGAKKVYDPETGLTASLTALDWKTSRPINSVDSSKGQYAFFSVRADISPLSLSTTFTLRALGLDRRYHILIEEDPAKRISPRPIFNEGGPQNVAERNYRLLLFEQFLEFLGPDPRRVTDQQE